MDNRESKKIVVKKTEHMKFTVEVEGIPPVEFNVYNPPTTIKAVRDAFGFYGYQGNKEFTEKLTITPRNMISVIRGGYFNTVVKPMETVVKRFGIRRGGLNYFAIAKCERHKDLFEQVIKDNQKNLEPIIWDMAKNTKELKEIFGKSLWKKLCKNSRYKNAALVKSGFIFKELVSETVSRHYTDDDKVAALKELNMVNGLTPAKLHLYSLVAPKVWHYNYDARYAFKLFNVIKDMKCPVSKIRKHRIGSYILLDTFQSIKELGIEPDISKFDNIACLEHYHDELSEIANKRREEQYKKMKEAEKVSYTEIIDYGFPVDYEGYGIKAKLLNTKQKVELEGRKMHHCVGSYRNRCYVKEYAVFHLTDGKEKVTLGLYAAHNHTSSGKMKWGVSQMYGVCNKNVENPNFGQLAADILNTWNEFVEIEEKPLEVINV